MARSKHPKAPKKNGDRLNIKVADDVAKGTYANFSIVHNSESDFVLDFVFIEPHRRQGQVVSRVIAHPRAAKRLLQGLTEMVRIHEERFGKIEMPDTVTPPESYH